VTETGGFVGEGLFEPLPPSPAPEQLPGEAHHRVARVHPAVPAHTPSLAQAEFRWRPLFGPGAPADASPLRRGRIPREQSGQARDERLHAERLSRRGRAVARPVV